VKQLRTALRPGPRLVNRLLAAQQALWTFDSSCRCTEHVVADFGEADPGTSPTYPGTMKVSLVWSLTALHGGRLWKAGRLREGMARTVRSAYHGLETPDDLRRLPQREER